MNQSDNVRNEFVAPAILFAHDISIAGSLLKVICGALDFARLQVAGSYIHWQGPNQRLSGQV